MEVERNSRGFFKLVKIVIEAFGNCGKCYSNVAITDRQVYFDNIYSDINFIQIKIVLIDSVMNWWYMIKMSFFLRLWSAVSVSLTNSSKRWNK